MAPAPQHARGLSPAPTPADQPRHGDVVVSRDPDARGRFTLLVVPGHPQASLASRDVAVDIARRFALRQGVDVWFDDGGEAPRREAPPATDGTGA